MNSSFTPPQILVCLVVLLSGITFTERGFSDDSTPMANQLQIERRSSALTAAQQMIERAGANASKDDWARLGDAQLRAGQSEQAVKSFEKVIDRSPESKPYLWQYGIALYFVGRYDDAQRLFEQHRIVNPNDVENAAWHFLCVAKASDVQQARKILLPAPGDRRAPMREILDRLPGGNNEAILNRMNALAKTSQAESANFYGQLYLGLIADAEGDLEEARKWMKLAAQTDASHYMADVARVYAMHLSQGRTVHRDLIYASEGDRALKLDLHQPRQRGADLSEKRSVIVLVHGGGWKNGSKEKFEALATSLCEAGFVVANINYRLATEAKFPAAIHDVKASVRWLRAHANQYQINPGRIAAVGGSAGGHLVGLLATTPGKMEGQGGWPDRSSSVQAAVLMGAGVDQYTRAKQSDTLVENCLLFFGGSVDEIPDVYKNASPITHVSKSTPPLLFLDGSLDKPGERYVEMRKMLDERGVAQELVVIEGAKHGNWNKPEFRKAFVDAITRFLSVHLK